MTNLNTTTQAQGARRVDTHEEYIFGKMLMDADILNFTHSQEGITFCVTKSGCPSAPYAVDITCGGIEFSRMVSNYPEFQALINVGLGYFLGVFDDIDSMVPEYISNQTE